MEKRAGFTVVEILIVCIVLGILVTIGTIGWSNTVEKSRDRTRETEQNAWAKSFETYRQRFVVYPHANASGVAIAGEHCLGTGFPGGRCKSSGSPIAENANSAIMQELEKVGTLPSYPHEQPAGGYIGPWVNYNTTGEIRIYQSYTQASCPEGTVDDTSYTGATVCYIRLTKN